MLHISDEDYNRNTWKHSISFIPFPTCATINTIHPSHECIIIKPINKTDRNDKIQKNTFVRLYSYGQQSVAASPFRSFTDPCLD